MNTITKQELIEFEKNIAATYLSAKIRGPIHLRSGAEDILIKIFKEIKDDDYVFCTWANHLECLLKGVPSELVRQRILDGHSMAMNFPEFNFYTSAIVGGTCAIATGTAYALKKQNKPNRVYAFIGDMTFLTGIATESIRYSINYDLPLTWIIADNNLSVSTPTREVWKEDIDELVKYWQEKIEKQNSQTRLKHYKFSNSYSHSGVGAFISF